MDLSEIPEEVRHLNLNESSITDEELGLICRRIKRIDMLDLHATSITNEGIKQLLKLESLKELRLKGNTGIDDGCMPYINQLEHLVFLHLRYTAVTVKGLQQISDLHKLETVLMTDDLSEEEIDELMKDITRALPDCTFCVNQKTWYPLQPWERIDMNQDF